jgi:hypothetical protein
MSKSPKNLTPRAGTLTPRRLTFTLLFAVLAGLIVVGPTAVAMAKTKKGQSSVVRVPGLYWGANIGAQLTGEAAPYGASAIPSFDKETGKSISIDHMGWPFATCGNNACAQFPFPREGAEDIRRAGAIPLISFQTGGFGSSYDWWFTDKAIAAGTWDSYFKKDAQEVKRWGHPLFLRFDWEMNGNWFPWAVGDHHNTVAQYVAAWRHVHDIFQAAGVTNVTWVWCPNVAEPDGASLRKLKSLYPGNQYVDWTCLDGYNTGDQDGGRFKSWTQIYKASYTELTQNVAPQKPLMVGEFGSSSVGGSKAAWISNALAVVPRKFPKIRALVYWDLDADTGIDYELETSADVLDAFRIGIANPKFVTGQYANLKPGKIAPPTVIVKR